MEMRMADLTHKRVLEWFRMESERAPTLAAQALRGLRAFVGWAARQDEFASITDATACNHYTIKEEEPQQKPKESDVLREAYLPLWFEQVRKLSNPVQGAYLQIALLTGARRNELAALKWVDVDFRFKTMEIRDKVEGRRTIPLTDYTAHLILQLPRRNEFVFSADSKSGRLEEPRAAHDKALDAAGLPHVSIHGLRRSFVTLAENAEVPGGVVLQLAGHKPSGVHEANYKRRDIDALTRWHQKI
jgi:integrase